MTTSGVVIERWSMLPVVWRRRVLVLMGGAAGGLLRELFGRLIAANPWPWATLAANALGSFVLGWVVARVVDPTRSELSIPLVGVGVCGALTTFGGLVDEVWSMVSGGRWAEAFGYLAASLAIGLTLAAGGMGVGRR
jgi:fluoride exporter